MKKRRWRYSLVRRKMRNQVRSQVCQMLAHPMESEEEDMEVERALLVHAHAACASRWPRPAQY